MESRGDSAGVSLMTTRCDLRGLSMATSGGLYVYRDAVCWRSQCVRGGRDSLHRNNVDHRHHRNSLL